MVRLVGLLSNGVGGDNVMVGGSGDDVLFGGAESDRLEVGSFT